MTRWEIVLPPSRPTGADLRRIRDIVIGIDRSLPVGVLGSTPEFRDLLAEEGFENVLVFERDAIFHRSATKFCVEELHETMVEGDWLETLTSVRGTLVLLLSDLTSGNVPYEDRAAFYQAISASLVPDGVFIDKVLTNEAPLIERDDLYLRYVDAPLNLATANRFSCEAIFCSYLIREGRLVDTTAFYEHLEETLPTNRLRGIASLAELITPRQCIWFYGRPWHELIGDYGSGLLLVARYGMDQGSAYKNRAFQYHWRKEHHECESATRRVLVV